MSAPSPFPRTLRRLAALATLPLAASLGACGLQVTTTIHEDQTVEQTLTAWDDTSTLTEADCTPEAVGLERYTPDGLEASMSFTTYNGLPAR